MKSKPYVLYLVLGAAALALWLAWSSANRHTAEPSASPGVAQVPPPEPSRAPLLTDNPLPAADTPGGKPPAGTPAPAVGATPGAAPATVVAATPAGATGLAPATNPGAQTDVGRVRHMVSDYHTLMGENPVGTNAEIMKQMMGGNSHQAMLGPPDGMTLNAQGELTDPWGTPYFFHQLSRDKMEVRSAGPDKIMWTADDVIAR